MMEVSEDLTLGKPGLSAPHNPYLACTQACYITLCGVPQIHANL